MEPTKQTPREALLAAADRKRAELEAMTPEGRAHYVQAEKEAIHLAAASVEDESDLSQHRFNPELATMRYTG